MVRLRYFRLTINWGQCSQFTEAFMNEGYIYMTHKNGSFTLKI